jgi:tetratricopeptide (TPR) repeat protein
LLLAVTAGAGPVSARPAPPPEQLFQGELAPLRPEFAAALRPGGDPAAGLRRFDALLAKLPAASAERGILLSARAEALSDLNRQDEAISAIEESISLLPGYSAPLFHAVDIYTFGGRPDRGADALLQASAIDPEPINLFDDYAIKNLLNRLEDKEDRKRIAAVADRLLKLGWANGLTGTQGRLVFAAIDARLEAGDIDGARALVPRLNVPARIVRILIDKKYDPIRAEAQAHAGARLEKVWPVYLAAAEARWRSTSDSFAAAEYAAALSDAGADSKLIGTFLPLIAAGNNTVRDEGLIFAVQRVASALAGQDRWDDAFALLDRANEVWGKDDRAQTLNITANRARLLVMKGDFEAGVAVFDKALTHSAQFGSEVNESALGAFGLYRACALHRLGRGAEAAASEALIARRRFLSPSYFVRLQICRGDLATARKFLIEALAAETSRSDALFLLQPRDERPLASAFAREQAEGWDRLCADPAIRAAALRFGYILDEPANAAALPLG